MAAANLDTNALDAKFNDIKATTGTALDGTDGGTYTVASADERTLLIIQNTDGTNAENVTIKAPAKPALGKGSAFADKVVSVAKSGIAVAMVESMRYMEADTHKVKIAGSADVKVSVIKM